MVLLISARVLHYACLLVISEYFLGGTTQEHLFIRPQIAWRRLWFERGVVKKGHRFPFTNRDVIQHIILFTAFRTCSNADKAITGKEGEVLTHNSPFSRHLPR